MILDLEIWHFVFVLICYVILRFFLQPSRPLLLFPVFLRAHELAFQCAPGTSSTCHFFGPQLSLLILTDSALASEFDVLNEGPPKESYVVDDAGVLSRSKADAFEYADQVLECWYPTVEECNKKGIVVLITSQKEAAVTGGPEFIQALVLATEEKYNEAVFSSAKRLVAAIDGLPGPGGPQAKDNKRDSNFKTREETDEKRGQFTLAVGGLLVIAFVVQQYYDMSPRSEVIHHLLPELVFFLPIRVE
ncbi:UNVERIFIED_CONTAM: hypothetical protein Scaly_2127100 [Sesamum calycinum]|uniref:TPM domain-containing protein n=1 Tax=Sesamum calycinum TaxID=2727403 RepID=A0AAW2MPA9_9LAMI